MPIHFHSAFISRSAPLSTFLHEHNVQYTFSLYLCIFVSVISAARRPVAPLRTHPSDNWFIARGPAGWETTGKTGDVVTELRIKVIFLPFRPTRRRNKPSKAIFTAFNPIRLMR